MAIMTRLVQYRDKLYTLTFDNGKEFSAHATIDEILDCQSYYAHPYSSWERGLNENTNGLSSSIFPRRRPTAIKTAMIKLRKWYQNSTGAPGNVSTPKLLMRSSSATDSRTSGLKPPVEVMTSAEINTARLPLHFHVILKTEWGRRQCRLSNLKVSLR